MVHQQKTKKFNLCMNFAMYIIQSFIHFEGLLDHFYDGCMGYWQSTARKNSFNFTLPFLPNVRASLHYKAGETIENATTVTGKKIGV